MTMPEVIEPAVNHVVAGAPLPEPGPCRWLVLQNHDSKYADEEGQHYEYPPRSRTAERVSVGDTIICCLSKTDATDEGRIFGVGTIGEIARGRRRPSPSRLLGLRGDRSAAVVRARRWRPPPERRPTRSTVCPMAFADRVRAARRQRPNPGTDGEVMLPEMDLTTGEGVRNALHDLVALDLLGPACGPEEELLEDAPRTRYVVGTLAPRDAPPDQLALDDRLDGAGETRIDEGGTDATVPASNTLFSSSIGFTFVVAAGVDTVSRRAQLGRVRAASRASSTSPNDGEPRMVWRRRPRGGPFELPLRDRAGRGDHPGHVERRRRRRGDRAPTRRRRVADRHLFLVNDQAGARSASRTAPGCSNPRLAVTATDGESAVFVRRDQRRRSRPRQRRPRSRRARHSRA